MSPIRPRSVRNGKRVFDGLAVRFVGLGGIGRIHRRQVGRDRLIRPRHRRRGLGAADDPLAARRRTHLAAVDRGNRPGEQALPATEQHEGATAADDPGAVGARMRSQCRTVVVAAPTGARLLLRGP
jgi:hypothetical protein